MLLEFSVENFLSIKDKVTMSLVASKDKSLNCNIISFHEINLLKSAVIYGPNASGKTNILKALSYITRLILNSDKNKPNEPIEYTPFKLNRTYEKKPSRFEIIFEIDSIKYIYGFSLDRDKIHNEYLYYYPFGRMATIFERDINDPAVYKFTADKQRQRGLKVNTPDNTLYLSKSANLNYEKTSVVVEWFREKMGIVLAQDFYLHGLGRYTKEVLFKNDIIKAQIKNLISKTDRNIVDVRVKEREIGEDFFKDFPKDIRDLLIEDARREVEMVHFGLDRDGNETEVMLKLSEESSGTQKMFNMAGPFIEVLSNGEILVMDEFEMSLHPHLVRYLIDIFNSPKYNKHGAQLLIATHNTGLLRPNIMRRDQIWLTEKKADHSTELRSLYEYKARKDKNIEKGYLSGRYGAIPIFD